MAPEPSGSASASARRGVEPIVIAAQRRHMTQQEMRDEHRHARDACACTTASGRHPPARPDPRASQSVRATLRLQRRDAPPQVQTDIDRHLLVARSAGVQPASRIADRSTSCRSTKLCTSSSGPAPIRVAPSLLKDCGKPVANRARHRRRSERRRPRVPRPTPGSRSRRLRTADGRRETTRRNRTPPDRAPRIEAAGPEMTHRVSTRALCALNTIPLVGRVRPGGAGRTRWAGARSQQASAPRLHQFASPVHRLHRTLAPVTQASLARCWIVARVTCAQRAIATDHENRVVACDRANDIGQARAVERQPQQLRLARPGLHHHELLRRSTLSRNSPSARESAMTARPRSTDASRRRRLDTRRRPLASPARAP